MPFFIPIHSPLTTPKLSVVAAARVLVFDTSGGASRRHDKHTRYN